MAGFRSSHVGLHVKDLDRSISFYKDVLGFTLVSSIKLDGGPRIAFVEIPEQFLLELVENRDMEEKADGPFEHICFRVDSFEDSFRSLKEQGIEFETDMLFSGEFWDHGMKFAFFRGPDRERLEIAEY